MAPWRVLSLALAPLAVPAAAAALEDPAAALSALCAALWLLFLAAIAIRQLGGQRSPLPRARVLRHR